MVMISSSIPTKAKINPLRIVSSALFFLFAILSVISAFTMTPLHFHNFQQISIDAPVYNFIPNLIMLAYFELFRFVCSILAPLLGIGATLLGLVSKRRWLQSTIGIGLFIVVFPISWVWEWSLSGVLSIVATQGFNWTQSWEPSGVHFKDTFLGWIALVCGFLAVLISIVASIASPKKFMTVSEEKAPPVTNGGQVSGAPSAISSPQSNLNNLPLFALIGAFVIPLAGIILGHLSLNYMKKGQLSDQNQGMAKIGLILGYVFVGLSFIVGLVIAVALVVISINRGY
jgi:hypothetical protein